MKHVASGNHASEHYYIAAPGDRVVFNYDSGNRFEVEIVDGMLKVRVSGSTGDMLAVAPDVSNQVFIRILRWDCKVKSYETIRQSNHERPKARGK